MPGMGMIMTVTDCGSNFQKVVAAVSEEQEECLAGGEGDPRLAGQFLQGSTPLLNLSQIPVPRDSERPASDRQLAGLEGPHEGGGRRLFLRRLQGRLGRR